MEEFYMKKRTLYLTQGAVIAAIYVVLVYVTNLIPGQLNYGMVQFRLAEALCVLPVFTPAAVPGLFLGCLISNFMSPLTWADWVFGSGATLLAAALTYALRKHPWTAPLPAILVNALVVGPELYFMGFIEVNGGVGIVALLAGIGSVFLGQLVVCAGLGYPLMQLLKKSKVFEPIS